MISFKALLQKFGSKGEKTGWTFIDIHEKIANKIKPGCKKSFRVKGKIDDHVIKALALTPMGDGNFILALNAIIRKSIKKIHGAFVEVQLEEDMDKLEPDAELITCLKDEPDAYTYFKNLPASHQNWFSNWIKAARTQNTKTKRMATVVTSCLHKLSFPEMMKLYRDEKKVIQ